MFVGILEKCFYLLLTPVGLIRVRRMDELPDELLLAIFGHLDQAETLVDGVMLVCRRWRDIARWD